MARFIKHTSCPRCGSRDNLGEYDDGSAYCFGCGFYRSRNQIPEHFRQGEPDDESVVTLPSDYTTDFPVHAARWLTKDGITIEEVLQAGIGYSPSYNQVLFPYENEEGKLTLIQARNFNPGKPKYFNKGSNHGVLHLIGNRGHSVVITEDALSAIKVARQMDACPALGTNFQADKIYRLIKKGYTQLIVWLDRDKWREAREIADKAKWAGLSAKTMFSELDPKVYTDEQIKEFLTCSTHLPRPRRQ